MDSVALSKNKAPVLVKGSKVEENLAPEDAIKSLFIKDEYSESNL